MNASHNDVHLHARAEPERIRRESERKSKARRAGRKKGELSDSLEEKLRACNPLQLKTVKRLCDVFLADHRHRPIQENVGNITSVQFSLRLQLEINCTAWNCGTAENTAEDARTVPICIRTIEMVR